MSSTHTCDLTLGDLAADKITGFTGIVVGVTFWLNGCTRVGLQPRTLKDGKTLDAEWFDEKQVKVVNETELTRQSSRGGPMPDPK